VQINAARQRLHYRGEFGKEHLGKDDITVVNLKKSRAGYANVRASAQDFHPHFKSQKQLDKNKKLCSILISGVESKT